VNKSTTEFSVTLLVLPARLNSGQTARLHGFAEHDVPILIAAKLLIPLGKPAPNGPKYFARVDVLSYAEDRDWLNRATKTLTKHWQKKNEQLRNKREKQGQRADGENMSAQLRIEE
jgi:hypothetical protein